MSNLLSPRNSTDKAILSLALIALFVALAAKSKTNGARGRAVRRPAPRRAAAPIRRPAPQRPPAAPPPPEREEAPAPAPEQAPEAEAPSDDAGEG